VSSGAKRESLRDQRDDRMERCPFRVRRRPAFQPRVGRVRQVLVQLVDEPRLADSRFAEDHDVLPLAVSRAFPAIDEYSKLHVAADEARQPSRRNVESAAYPARLHDAVERHRLANALQHLRPAVLDHEKPSNQALRGGGDDHRVGPGCALHARRDVCGLAEHLAAVGDDDGAGCMPMRTAKRVP
jgi:hypothetical protein